MTLHYSDNDVTLHLGDCIEVMRTMPDSSIDAIVTDPPYGLGFMGKAWDALPPGLEWAEQCLRVLKPGGHVLAFGGSRTWHRLAVAIEDAGFEIRDSIAWLYGSGFPKSLDVSKAIDKAAGAERAVLGTERNFGVSKAEDGKAAFGDYAGEWNITAPATDAAKRWQGWGTALKPAFEPIVVGRKPLVGTVAANVLQHGVGALNIDACRIGSVERPVMVRTATVVAASSMSGASTGATNSGETTTQGRWPANAVMDESQAAVLDEQSGITVSGGGNKANRATTGTTQVPLTKDTGQIWKQDKGGASRFFYVAKAPASQRPKVDGIAHPTVKPLDLMRWLVRLVTPPNGVILEPFLGSGTTAEAARLEGFHCIGIERDPSYMPLVMQRLGIALTLEDEFPWLRAA